MVEPLVIKAIARWFSSLEKNARYSRYPPIVSLAKFVSRNPRWCQPTDLEQCRQRLTELQCWLQSQLRGDYHGEDVLLKAQKKTRELMALVHGVHSRAGLNLAQVV